MEPIQIIIKTKTIKKEIKLLLKIIKKSKLPEVKLNKQLNNISVEIINVVTITLNDYWRDIS